jgi:ankyrin repeat protein
MESTTFRISTPHFAKCDSSWIKTEIANHAKFRIPHSILNLTARHVRIGDAIANLTKWVQKTSAVHKRVDLRLAHLQHVLPGKQYFCNEANRGNLHVVQKLYHHHGAAIVNAPRQHGWTALHYVSMSDARLEILKYLVETCGANICAVDFGGATPLHHACWYGTLEVVQYLVEMAGANVHAVDETRSTPLHYANIGGKVDIIKYLVESAGADIHAVDNNGHTPLQNASRGGKLEVMKYLVESTGASIQAVKRNGDTLLHLAISHCQLEVVKYLHQCGADIHAKNNAGHTPLHTASGLSTS